MEFSVEQVAALLQGAIENGTGEEKVSMLSKIEEGQKGSLSFLANPKYEKFIYETKATAVIVREDFEAKSDISAVLIKVKDPYLAFTNILTEYEKFLKAHPSGTQAPSFQADSAQHEFDDVYLGAFSYIGEGVQLAKGVKIYPHVYIGDGVSIGEGTVLYSGAKIYKGCKIGKNCVIHAGAVVGSDGFGYAPTEDGSFKAIPQIGVVELKDFVEIGANSTIDRATMGATVINEGSKLDNLVQVAHNVVIGKHTVIAAQSGFAGSSKIGDHCMFGGQSAVVGHVSVGNQIKVGGQAAIMSNTKDNESALIGSPAMNARNYMKSYVIFKKLPDLKKRIEKLEEKIVSLSNPK